jgi:hypothetical protein
MRRMPSSTSLSAFVGMSPSRNNWFAEARRRGVDAERVRCDAQLVQPRPQAGGVLALGELPHLLLTVPAPLPGEVQPPVDPDAEQEPGKRVGFAVDLTDDA